MWFSIKPGNWKSIIYRSFSHLYTVYKPSFIDDFPATFENTIGQIYSPHRVSEGLSKLHQLLHQRLHIWILQQLLVTLVLLGEWWTRGFIQYLIGGFNPSEKYWSVGMIIPNIYGKKHVPNHRPDMDMKFAVVVDCCSNSPRTFICRVSSKMKKVFDWSDSMIPLPAPIYKNIYIYIILCMYIYICICACICILKHVCICACICDNVCAYIYMIYI